ncbi:mRNA-capping enzyme subunit beta [Tulasnella sp. JGI-2019a]|nr:mRNA-capping enzyme subunit beta [Tulasnella sp. JGI-2019a]KAG9033965.1 mRNA-capping enzyme subunit beta [Tulasnella sp. JGI-2019a]
MASSSHPPPEATYYEEYSDPEDDEKQSNGAVGTEEGNDEDEDFISRPRRDSSPAPIPFELSQVAAGSKRKAPTHPSPDTGGRAATNGGHQGPIMDPSASKRHKPEPLEPSILNAEPLDEFVLEIADWIHRVSLGKTNVEVEAKVGLIMDSRTGERVNLPVMNETILSPEYPEIRFSSNMSIQQHASYNQALNKLIERTNSPKYPNAKFHYEHTKVIDSFYTPPSGSGFSSGSGKVRVTKDAKTGEVKECIQKVRIADLNIYSPKRKLDWRLSVNTEIPVPIPIASTQPQNTRKKDRMTYTHQSFKIDLTQVAPSTAGSSNPTELLHELEIEFADSAELMRLARVRTRGTGAAWSGQEGELFDELVRVFVNNVRILIRNAGS